MLNRGVTVTRMLEVECGDMREVLRTLPDNSFDSCVCDPPYELGFMGKSWDSTGIAFDAAAWAEVFRVLKPGAHIVAFGGTRTWHRIAVAIEDAGFQIRDSLAWIYGQGMPKSSNISKLFDKAAGAEREVIGTRILSGSAAMSTQEKGGTYASNTDSRGRKKEVDITAPATDLAKKYDGIGTALKPCIEPIILARKPLIGTLVQNYTAHGVGGLNIDACRTPAEKPTGWGGGGSALEEGGLSRTGGEARPVDGRWPPNVCVDEAVAADLDAAFGTHKSTPYKGGPKQKRGQIFDLDEVAPGGYADAGGVSRYFYCPKAAGAERDAGLEHWPVLSAAQLTGRADSEAPGTKNGRSGAKGEGRRNVHATVKPLTLMRWLCKLVTPPGGFILDPFTGSGTTGCAAALEGFHFAGIELDPIHVKLARDRISHWFKSISVDGV